MPIPKKGNADIEMSSEDGSKFIPIVGGVSWEVTGYAAIQGCRGYSYTKVTIKYEH